MYKILAAIIASFLILGFQGTAPSFNSDLTAPQKLKLANLEISRSKDGGIEISNFSNQKIIVLTSGSSLERKQIEIGGLGSAKLTSNTNDSLDFEIIEPANSQDISNFDGTLDFGAFEGDYMNLLEHVQEIHLPPILVGSPDYAYAATLPASTSFRYSTFIPQKFVDAPIICSALLPLTYFGGDARTWGVVDPNYRTRFVVTIDWVTGGTATATRSVGATTLYSAITGQYILTDSRRASNSGMTIKQLMQDGNDSYFEIAQNVTNPFCPSALVGGIRSDYKVNVSRSGAYWMDGYSVKVPSHEVYIKDSDTSIWTTVLRNVGVDFSCLTTWQIDPNYCQDKKSYAGVR